MINKIVFPEYTNAQINAALIADKLNEVIAFINDNTIPAIEPDDEQFLHEIESQIVEGTEGTGYSYQGGAQIMKEGVTYDGNGHYRLNGRLIKKTEAYVEA